MNYLLDTSALSDIIAEDPATFSRLDAVPSGDAVVTCTVARGEVLYGIRRMPDGKKRRSLEAKAPIVLASFRCEPLTPAIADEYADLKAAQERIGCPLDENDLWIAATARHLGATVVTRDADFRRVPGLAVEDWSR